MSEKASCGLGDVVTEFQKNQIIGLHQIKKTTVEIVKMTGSRLRTVQGIVLNSQLGGRNAVRVQTT